MYHYMCLRFQSLVIEDKGVISGPQKLGILLANALTLWFSFLKHRNMDVYGQASMLTQSVTGPVGSVAPRIYWSRNLFTGPTNYS